MKLYIKHMVCERCKMFVRRELEKMGLHCITLYLGEIEIKEELTYKQHKQLKDVLLPSGLELMDDKGIQLIQKAKDVIVEMIYNSDELPKLNYSAYLSERLDHDYADLSNLFSKRIGISIQKFILFKKIERVKNLLVFDELSLTDIAYKMHYSSVAHLSNQFKKIIGISPSNYVASINRLHVPLEIHRDTPLVPYALVG